MSPRKRTIGKRKWRRNGVDVKKHHHYHHDVWSGGWNYLDLREKIMNQSVSQFFVLLLEHGVQTYDGNQSRRNV